jgi:hypothetical protein
MVKKEILDYLLYGEKKLIILIRLKLIHIIIIGKLYDALQNNCKTECKEDAENCLIIYNKLEEMYAGSVWNSNWTPLVNTIFKRFS